MNCESGGVRLLNMEGGIALSATDGVVSIVSI